jgi:hypothetical protein
MPRRRFAVLVALVLAAAAGAGCGSDAPRQVEVVPGKRAGVVLEAAGTVTATRPGQAARPLEAGDEVSGDDEIQTGADGTVLVELDHNHVTFSLAANRTQKVGASPAWTQPIAAARPATTDEHSAAAGRPVERSAVDTSASAGGGARPAAPAAAAPPPADEPSGGAMPAPEREKAPEPKPEKNVAPREVAPLQQAAAPQPSTDRAAPRLDRKSGGGGGSGAPADVGALAADKADVLADYGNGEAGGPPTDDLSTGSLGKQVLDLKVKGGLTRADVAALIAQALDACWTDRPATVILSVAADGSITSVTTPDRRTLDIETDTANTAAAVCAKQALATTKLPAKRKKSTITVSR